ncbi:MAG: hypothetical protein VX614_07145 [Myxococcota bacterium]|nr:hypothetical protein [Myxococcota bacterium]
MSGALRGFLILGAEACRDGLRRRFAFVVAVVLLLGLGATESCTTLEIGAVSVNDRTLDAHTVSGFLAPFLFTAQALIVVVMAGVLASDHLARPLAEGTALLWLARPIDRGVFAAARLAGALGVALGAGLVLLLGTGAMLVVRQGLAVGPALLGMLGTGLGCVVVAALAMLASLSLGRTAVLLLVVVGVPFVAAANAWALFSMLIDPQAEIAGISGAMLYFGPPVGFGILGPVAVWNPYVEETEAGAALLRLGLWAVGACCLTWLRFRRMELGAGHSD